MQDSPIPAAGKLVFEIVTESNQKIISVGLPTISNSSSRIFMWYLFYVFGFVIPMFFELLLLSALDVIFQH